MSPTPTCPAWSGGDLDSSNLAAANAMLEDAAGKGKQSRSEKTALPRPTPVWEMASSMSWASIPVSVTEIEAGKLIIESEYRRDAVYNMTRLAAFLAYQHFAWGQDALQSMPHHPFLDGARRLHSCCTLLPGAAVEASLRRKTAKRTTPR
ncbi:hypothetical protein TYRP_023467 [Tyrophagus putrescentiae]|nr:hypothetical protein TYRP_023467 [Tyrophagus putrescentiae]